jgi:MoaA/NifB/PqqE/SkfB family radical SAM enzyme
MRFFDTEISGLDKLYSIREGIQFLNNHTIRQNTNALRYFFNRKKNCTKLSWNPVYSTIVVESKCNQRCQFCLWHSVDTPRPYWPVHLSFGDFKRIADILAKQNVAHLHFCGTGEPLLNRDLFKMIEYAKEMRFTTSMMSNSSSVMTPCIEKIARSGIIRFFTNIDSGFPEQLEDLKRNADWKILIKNLKRLSEIRKREKLRFKISIYCIAMKSNYKSFHELMHVVHDIGADEVWFSYLQPFEEMNYTTSSQNVIQKNDYPIIKEIQDAVALGKKLGLHVFPPHYPAHSSIRINCDAMWWKMMINLPTDKIPQDRWIGNVSTHCFLAHTGDAYSFGNLFTDDFNDIWNGEKIQLLRKQLLTDAPMVCKKCPDL